MVPVTRTAQFSKVHKVLKKYYKPVAPPAERSLLEHLLFACCLEDARYEPAEESFAALVHTFFDWNEVRVTSLSELSEVLSALPDPRVAAHRLKRVLHGIFEEGYSFDLEAKRKGNLGPTVKWLEKIEGTTPFSVAYVVQSALGGHSIPIDSGTAAVLRVLDLITDKDQAECAVPGLERAMAKSKGIEFGSLLHQLGADYTANPFGQQVRDILLQIEPTAAERFPQRRAARVKPAPVGEAAASPPAAADEEPRPAAPRKKKAHPADDSAPPAPPAAEGKKPAAHGKKPTASGEPHAAEPKSPPGQAAKEKSPAEGLAKRKPR